MESFTARQDLTVTWKYRDLFRGTEPLEVRSDVVGTFLLHGGWTVELKPVWESYAFDPSAFATYRIPTAPSTGVSAVPYPVPDRVNDVYGLSFRVATPRFRQFGADVTVFPKRDVEFREGTDASSLSINGTLDWRPNDKIRVSPLLTHLHHNRERDGTLIDNQTVARLKVEYQLSRPIFFRFVGQYTAQEKDALYDPATGRLIYFTTPSGALTPSTRTVSNALRVDWLFSYQPNPGTVIFAGYGSSLTEPDAYTFQNLRRVNDGFFVKLSYLFRM